MSLVFRVRALVVAALFILPALASGQDNSFWRSLRLGMRGDDVQALQQILNSDPDTIVAHTGPGSKGNETEYFGPLTLNAVRRFQEKYKNEILTPAGLTVPSGYVGQFTIAKLNVVKELKLNSPIGFTPDPNYDATVELMRSTFSDYKEKVRVTFPSTYSGTRNNSYTLYGTGFQATGNTIHIGENYKIENVPSSDQVSLAFEVPQSLLSGKYDIYVSNSLGESAKGRGQFFIVTENNATAPVIESLFPESGPNGTDIEIRGTGFLAANEVWTGYGVYNIPSSDGKTISLRIYHPPFDKLQELRDKRSQHVTVTEIPVWIHVINANGLSEAKQFKVTLK